MSSADGAAGGRRIEIGPSGSERMSLAIYDAVREKRARRLGNGRPFSDGVVRGVEPTPIFTDPRLEWALECGR